MTDVQAQPRKPAILSRPSAKGGTGNVESLPGKLGGRRPQFFVDDLGFMHMADLAAAAEEMNSLTNDRAIATLAAMVLDICLEAALKHVMLDEAAVLNEVFNDGGSLGAVSSKVAFAYLLKILDVTNYNNMKILIQIRNKLAHRLHISSFDHPDISNCAIRFINPHAAGGPIFVPAYTDMASTKDRFIFVWNECVKFLLICTGANEYISRFMDREELTARIQEHYRAAPETLAEG